MVATDVSPALGGTASAPTPSELLYTALASCLAIGYRMRAAERGIELTHVRVTVEGDADVTGMLTPCATSPGATALRYRVEIDSPAPADEVAAIVDIADRLSPVLADLTRPVPATRTLAINAGTAA